MHDDKTDFCFIRIELTAVYVIVLPLTPDCPLAEAMTTTVVSNVRARAFIVATDVSKTFFNIGRTVGVCWLRDDQNRAIISARAAREGDTHTDFFFFTETCRTRAVRPRAISGSDCHLRRCLPSSPCGRRAPRALAVRYSVRTRR